MWVLLLMILTTDGYMAVYDQGIYKDMDDCMFIKHAMLEEDFKDSTSVQLTCVRIEK